MVPSEKKKVEAYVRGLPENIKGETTSSRPVVLNEAVRMAHTTWSRSYKPRLKELQSSTTREIGQQQQQQQQQLGKLPEQQPP
ncbi:hypothetical protein Tco_1439544 [Tanacetum coccineum]